MAGKGFSATPNTGEFRNIGSPGVRSTGAYLIGARPFIIKTQIPANKTYKFIFPYITRAVTVINMDAQADDCDVSFASSANAFSYHSISLDNNRDSITMNVRTDSVYIKTNASAAVDIEIFAELTDIPSTRFGSGWTGKGIDSNHGDAATKLLEIEDVT